MQVVIASRLTSNPSRLSSDGSRLSSDHHAVQRRPFKTFFVKYTSPVPQLATFFIPLPCAYSCRNLCIKSDGNPHIGLLMKHPKIQGCLLCLLSRTVRSRGGTFGPKTPLHLNWQVFTQCHRLCLYGRMVLIPGAPETPLM